MFLRASLLRVIKYWIFGIGLTLYSLIQTFNDLWKEPFENIMEKGENAGNQHVLLFE